MTVLFIHSAGPQGEHAGSSDLVAYLKNALHDSHTVIDPSMPDPENPRYEHWKNEIEKELHTLGEEVILVGHSLGGSVLLKYLSEEPSKKSIAGLFLIAAPYWRKKDWEINEYILRRDFARKLPQIPKIFLYHSRDDTWVPFAHLADYSKELPQATVRELEGNDHEFSRGLPHLVSDIISLNKEGTENRTNPDNLSLNAGPRAN